ncbi:hypothetical protein P3E10_27980, partial [Pseudomonas aeruginosa]
FRLTTTSPVRRGINEHQPPGKRGIHARPWRVRCNVGNSASDDVFADPFEASPYSTARRLTGRRTEWASQNRVTGMDMTFIQMAAFSATQAGDQKVISRSSNR